MPVELVSAFRRRVSRAFQFAGHNRELHREAQRRELALTDVVVRDADPQRRQAVDGVPLGLLAGKAVQQALAHHIVDGVIGAHADGFAGLLKRLADVTKRVNQLPFAHLAIESLAVEGGDSQQKGESVHRQRDREIIFSGPGNQFGDCLGKFTHR